MGAVSNDLFPSVYLQNGDLVVAFVFSDLFNDTHAFSQLLNNGVIQFVDFLAEDLQRVLEFLVVRFGLAKGQGIDERSQRIGCYLLLDRKSTRLNSSH